MKLEDLFRLIEDKHKPESAYDEEEYYDYPGEHQVFGEMGESYDHRVDDR